MELLKLAKDLTGTFDESKAKRLDLRSYIKTEDFGADEDIADIMLEFDVKKLVQDLRKLGFQGTENDVSLRIFFGRQVLKTR